MLIIKSVQMCTIFSQTTAQSLKFLSAESFEWIIAVVASLVTILVVVVAMIVVIFILQAKWSRLDPGSEASSEVGLKSPTLKVKQQKPLFLVQTPGNRNGVTVPCWDDPNKA